MPSATLDSSYSGLVDLQGAASDLRQFVSLSLPQVCTATMADTLLAQQPAPLLTPEPAATEPAATTPADDAAAQRDDIRASLEELWYLKEISFRPDPAGPPKKFKVITQNYNG